MKPPSKYKNKIVLGDAVAVLKKMPEEIVDLGITSPPYNKQEKNNGGLVSNVVYSSYRDKLPEDEKQFQKTVNSAFIGTALEDHLQKNNIFSLVIVGLTTDHCVSTTTRMASNLGFNVILVSDATATFGRMGHDGNEYSADEIHKTGLARLNGEFCVIRSTEEVLNDFKEAC